MGSLRQVSFGGGEISEKLHSRTDLALYGKAAAKLRNYMVTPEGNATTRPGAVHRSLTANYQDVFATGRPARLVPFTFSNDQTYVLEFTPGCVRIFKGGEPVVVGASLGVWDAQSEYGAGDIVTHAGSDWLSQSARIGQSEEPGFSSAWRVIGPSRRLEVSTPYAQVDLDRLQWCQSGDVLVLQVAGQQTMQLQRLAELAWVMPVYSFNPLDRLQAPTGLTLATGAALWDAAHPKRQWVYAVTSVRLGFAGDESLPSAPYYVSELNPCYPDRPILLDWNVSSSADGYFVYKGESAGRMGYLGFTTSSDFRDEGAEPIYEEPPPKGYDPFALDAASRPQAVAFHSQRLFLANTGYAPATVWATQFSRMHTLDRAEPPRPDDGIQLTLASRQFEEVRAMLSAGHLRLFTSEQEWVAAGVGGEPISAESADAQVLSSHGSSWVQPLMPGNVPLFVTREGHVRESPLDSSGGKDISLPAQHLFRGRRIVAWAWQRTPNKTIWCALDNGQLVSLSYLPESDQLAWAAHDSEGVVRVLDLCVVSEDNVDRLYLLTDRTAAGWHCVERLALREASTVRDYVGLDAAVVVDTRNADPARQVVVTFSGGNNAGDIVTLQTSGVPSGGCFDAACVGDDLVVIAPDGFEVRIEVTYADADSGSGVLRDRWPVVAVSYSTSSWGWSRLNVGGRPAEGSLAHLADGDDLETEVFVVSRGQVHGPFMAGLMGDGVGIELPEEARSTQLVVGLLYWSDLGLLDAHQGPSLRTRQKLVTQASFELVDSAPRLQVGENFEHLVDWAPAPEDAPGVSGLLTDLVSIPIESEWNTHGRAVLRSAGLPVTVVAAIREVSDA